MRLFKHSDFPFHDKPNTASITCIHVLNRERPVLHVTHDEDGYWQFLCGASHSEEEARVISLAEAYELDKSVGLLAEMDYGCSADRNDVNSNWKIQ